MTNHVPDQLRERFRLEPARFERLTGGYRHAMFRHGDVVVRFELDPAPLLRWQHDVVRFFALRIREVHAPLAFEDGVSIWPFVDGRRARRNREPDALAAAELLGRLHRAAPEWLGGQRPGARTTEGKGVRAPMHGDFYPANLLMRGSRIVALFDWEESCVDLLDYELANAVWEFCKSKRTHDFDRTLAQRMTEAYGSDATTDDLVELIIVRRRLELVATDDEDYRRHTARAIARLGG